MALVTGGTSGIGKEIVKELLIEGCKVITCYHNNDEAAKETEKEFNNENLLIVNNAGTFIDNFIKDFDVEDFKRVLNVNLLGKVICTKHAYDNMNDKLDIFIKTGECVYTSSDNLGKKFHLLDHVTPYCLINDTTKITRGMTSIYTKSMMLNMRIKYI